MKNCILKIIDHVNDEGGLFILTTDSFEKGGTVGSPFHPIDMLGPDEDNPYSPYLPSLKVYINVLYTMYLSRQ